MKGVTNFVGSEEPDSERAPKQHNENSLGTDWIPAMLTDVSSVHIHSAHVLQVKHSIFLVRGLERLTSSTRRGRIQKGKSSHSQVTAVCCEKDLKSKLTKPHSTETFPIKLPQLLRQL